MMNDTALRKIDLNLLLAFSVLMQERNVSRAAERLLLGQPGLSAALKRLREALDDELVARGFGPPTYAANWYPNVEHFTAVYEQAGFKDIEARLIERPTPLEHGVAAWVTTFRAGWLDRAGVPDEEREAIAEAVANRVGTDVADYVRLRFIMRKPN